MFTSVYTQCVICQGKKETTLSSSTIDELGSWCLNIGGGRKWISGQKEVSMATQRLASTNSNVTPIQPVQYLPTRYLPESGNEGKAFNIESKMNVLYTSQKKKKEHKVTTRDSLPNSGLLQETTSL